MVNTLLLIGLIAIVILALVGLAFILRGVELLFPKLSAWLDERLGPDSEDGW